MPSSPVPLQASPILHHQANPALPFQAGIDFGRESANLDLLSIFVLHMLSQRRVCCGENKITCFILAGLMAESTKIMVQTSMVPAATSDDSLSRVMSATKACILAGWKQGWPFTHATAVGEKSHACTNARGLTSSRGKLVLPTPHPTWTIQIPWRSLCTTTNAQESTAPFPTPCSSLPSAQTMILNMIVKAVGLPRLHRTFK